MSDQALPKSRPVQGSEWMVSVRDSPTDMTLAEWALGALYGTYGNWGEKAYPSDRWIAKRLHIGRDKLRDARESLIAKGLLENIGQAPNGQPNQFMYRLTVPVEGVDPSRATYRDGAEMVDLDRSTVDPHKPRGGPIQGHGGPAVSPQELHSAREDLDRATGAAASREEQKQDSETRQTPEEWRAELESLRLGREAPELERTDISSDDTVSPDQTARYAAGREMTARITETSSRLKEIIRSAVSVSETDARAQLDVDDDTLWENARATLLGQRIIKTGYERGTGRLLKWGQGN